MNEILSASILFASLSLHERMSRLYDTFSFQPFFLMKLTFTACSYYIKYIIDRFIIKL